MKEYIVKNKVFGFPDCWEDLTAEEFVIVAGLLNKYINAEIDILTFRILAVSAITGYKAHWWPPKRRRQEENLYKFAEGFNFPFRMEENKVFLNLFFRRNMLHDFSFAGFDFTGPDFEISESGGQWLLDTDITAEHFVGAVECFNLYTKSKDLGDLRRLVKLLYRCEISDVRRKTDKRVLPNAMYASLTDNHLFAVFLVFKSFMEFITEKSVFKLLWGGDASGKLNLGIGEMVLNLVTDGYGTVEQVSRMPIQDFLFAQLKDRFDGAREMKAYEKPIGEIVKATGLPSEVVSRL